MQPAPSRTEIRNLLLACGIFLIAFYLRVRTLDWRPLWFDEALEYWVTVASFGEVLDAATRLTFDPPLYSYILHLWSRLGAQELWLRAPSLFFSLLALAALAHLAKNRLGWKTGHIAAMLVAFSAADIRYAQEVGQYALMIVLLSWNLVFLNAVRRESSLRMWGLWGVTAVMSIYTHYGAIIVIAVTSGFWLVRSMLAREWRAVGRQLGVGTITAALLAPLFLRVTLVQMDRFAPHIAPAYVSDFFVQSNKILLFHFVGSEAQTWTWLNISPWLAGAPLVVLLLLSFAGTKHFSDWPVLLLGAWLLYFLLGLNAIYVFAATRHSLLLFPLLMLSVAGGIAFLWDRQRVVATVALIAVLTVSFFAPPEAPQDLRSVTNFWAESRDAGQATYVYYGAAPAFRYQLRLRRDDAADVPPDWYNDCWAGQPAPYCVQDDIYYGRWLRPFDAAEKREMIFETLGQRPAHFWIIFSHTNQREMNELLSQMSTDYRIAAEHRASHAAALLLERAAEVQGR